MIRTEARQVRIAPLLLFVLFACVLLASPAHAQTFAKGADISWITQMEASGYRWSNDNGTQQDLLQILKDHGMNTIRLRVWVNPSGGWSGVNDVLAKAQRAKNAGMRIMIDFHYSDSWADPGKQTKPAAWRTHTFDQLMADVYQHTFNTMNTLASNGIFPEWVQVGNETNNGMLWEDGRASANMRNYAWLVNSGYDAVKAVSPNSKVIVHVSNGYDNALFRWNFDGLRSNGARWDIIGMSLYPEPNNWQTLVGQAITNINDMRSRYGKGVMLVEVGMAWDQATASKAFLTDLITRSRNAGALGVLYWEPQAFNWQGYSKGAWNTNGRPTIALDAFIEGSTPPPPPPPGEHHAAGKPHRLLRRGRHDRQQQCGLHRRGVREHQQRHGNHGALARERQRGRQLHTAVALRERHDGQSSGHAAHQRRQWLDGGIAGHRRVDHLDQFEFGKRQPARRCQ